MTDQRHDEIRESLAAYSLGALGPEEESEVFRHVAECPECRSELDDFEEKVSWLDSAAPPLPMGLADRVVTAARAGEREVTNGDGADNLGHAFEQPRIVQPAAVDVRGSKAVRWLGVAAACIALAVGIWGRSALRDAEQRARKAEAALQQLLSDEDKLDFRRAGKADARIVRTAEQTLFVAADLPELPASETYQLWVISEAQPRSVGTFEAPRGFAVQEIPTQESFDAAIVTVEPTGGSETPTLPALISAP